MSFSRWAFLRAMTLEADRAEYEIEITTVELCTAFLLAGHELPFLVDLGSGPQWTVPSKCAAAELLGCTFAAKHGAFSKLFRAVLASLGIERGFCSVSRVDSGIIRGFPALFIPWLSQVAVAVHHGLRAWHALLSELVQNQETSGSVKPNPSLGRKSAK